MKSNSSAVSTANIQIYGRETCEPMRCTETEITRLDLSVTKFTRIVHHPDVAREQEKQQLLDIQQIRGGKTKLVEL